MVEAHSKTAPLNNDDALIQQVKHGNVEAFHALYERYFPVVYKRVRYRVPADELEDVIQEIFITAFRSLPTYRGDGHFGAWLGALTKHTIAIFYRKRGLQQTLFLENSSASEGDGPESLEELIQIRSALKELPEHYREIILQRFVEDLKFHEIAELQGCSLEAAKSLYRRAIHALTEIYKKKK